MTLLSMTFPGQGASNPHQTLKTNDEERQPTPLTPDQTLSTLIVWTPPPLSSRAAKRASGSPHPARRSRCSRSSRSSRCPRIARSACFLLELSAHFQIFPPKCHSARQNRQFYRENKLKVPFDKCHLSATYLSPICHPSVTYLPLASPALAHPARRRPRCAASAPGSAPVPTPR
jgi:hypothetical protein